MTKEEDKKNLKEMANPRVRTLARYEDLDGLINKFFSDGSITDAELNALSKIDSILTTEFRVAQDYLSKMDEKSPLYRVGKDLVAYMYRCRTLIDKAHAKAKICNSIEDEEERYRVVKAAQVQEERKEQEKKEVLTLTNVGTAGVMLMLSLITPAQRMQAEQSFSQKEVQKLSPKERQEIELRLIRAMQAMREGQINTAQLNQILDLGRSR
ncbi:MAG: hypothetical protein IKY98_00765 [Alphaproteobacteria bacterium]|nr:hypothetical protein [Alphaproteobacteria bacterium]